ncbi:PIN domain-containing protein [Caenimonas sp. SL110]|uniref:PIN domain-containing protein n=1 Tax=Caenimonas sp. SL110 TaxID=1450524 RepID=UPI000653255F|nr:PIN domain-containing protein [Caenimonas sp. SL110]
MFHVLIDTSVWLDLAADSKQAPLLRVLEDFIDNGALKLIVPRVVHDEFHKNRERIEKTSAKGLATHFQQVKEAIKKVGTDSVAKKQLLTQLDDVNHKLPLIGGAAAATLDSIAKILDRAGVLETASEAKMRAAERALQRQGPCHHENKNSIADAIIIETYRMCVERGGARERFAFVTHNKNDFSAHNNQKLPHPDLASSFTKIKSLYFIQLGDLVNRVAPNVTRQLLWEYTFNEEPRGLKEIQDALELLWRQVWYNRHLNVDHRIKRGEHRIVSPQEWERNKDYQNTTIDTVWRRAVAARVRTERQLGMGNIGPWDDFEWGMINGKLSALRWALGDDWDMLDT